MNTHTRSTKCQYRPAISTPSSFVTPLASLAAVVSMSAGHYSTEAMVGQIESANQWSYFQSKSIKESQLKSKTELLEALGKPTSESDSKKAAEYRGDKEKIQKKAEELAVEARSSLSTHHILARSVTMFQIRKREILYIFGILDL